MTSLVIIIIYRNIARIINLGNPDEIIEGVWILRNSWLKHRSIFIGTYGIYVGYPKS